MGNEHKTGLRPAKTLEILDQVSETFCLAKWLQVTMNLHTGTNASCCLTPYSRFSLEEIKKDPSIFHNTLENKYDRKGLLNGKKISSCNYCWVQEKNQNKLTSERIYKSSSPWAHKHLDKVIKAKGVENINPTYLEVSFSNKCNLRCIYCNPHTSSGIYNEVKKLGPYTDSLQLHDIRKIDKFINLYEDERQNPYIDYFFDWFDNISDSLEVIRVTGGEPLLAENLFKLLEKIKEKPHPNIIIEINSNLSVPTTTVQRLIAAFELIPRENYKGIKIITSLDTGTKEAEYIRNGLKVSLLKENVSLLLESIPDLEMRFTVTFSLFSLFNFDDFLDYVLSLKRKYQTYDKILLSIYPLVTPYCLSLKILDKSFDPKIHSILEKMKRHQISDLEPYGFNAYEIDSMAKIVEFYAATYPESTKQDWQQDFFFFTKEYDYRKNTNLIENFPELEHFYKFCENLTKDSLNLLLKKKSLTYEDCQELIKAYQREAIVSCAQKEKIENQFKSYIFENYEKDLVKVWTYINSLYRPKIKDVFRYLLAQTLKTIEKKQKLKETHLWVLKQLNNIDNDSVLVDDLVTSINKTVNKKNSFKDLDQWIEIIDFYNLTSKQKLHLISEVRSHIINEDFMLLKIFAKNDLNTWLALREDFSIKSCVFGAGYFKDELFFRKFIESYSWDKNVFWALIDYFINYRRNEKTVEIILCQRITPDLFNLLNELKSQLVKDMELSKLIRFKKVFNLLKFELS